MSDIYYSGIGFKNPTIPSISYTRGEEFITYSRSNPRKGVWNSMLPAWEESPNRPFRRNAYHGGIDNMDSYSLGGWLNIAIKKAKAKPMSTNRFTIPKSKRGFTSMAMQAIRDNLHVQSRSIPSYAARGLGEISTAGNSAPSAFTSVTGFLQNLVSTGAGLYQTQQATKLAQITAQTKAIEASLYDRMKETTSKTSTTTLILGIGGAALFTLMMLKRKRKG